MSYSSQCAVLSVEWLPSVIRVLNSDRIPHITPLKLICSPFCSRIPWGDMTFVGSRAHSEGIGKRPEIKPLPFKALPPDNHPRNLALIIPPACLPSLAAFDFVYWSNIQYPPNSSYSFSHPGRMSSRFPASKSLISVHIATLNLSV